MFIYVLRRILYTVPIAIGVSLVCFALIHLAPGDPLSAIIPEGASPEMIAQIRTAYGFDRPLPVQYLKWLGHVVTGDFGTSIMTRRPVLSEVLPAIANTLTLAAAAVTFGFGWDSLQYLILPALTLSVIPAGIIARSVRGTVAEVRKQDYMQTLYAKGLPGRRVFVHVVKNALPAVLAVMGLQLAQLLGGSILVETVFSWPGTGFLLNNAIFTRDLPMLQGTILMLAMFFVLINLLVDILQTAVNPRIKRA